MTTIKDVARLAGVSVTTVSATINGTAPVSEKLKGRVREAIRDIGYSPDPFAQTLRSGQTATVGLIVPDIASPYSAHLAKSMQLALSEYGYRVFFSSNDDDPVREAEDIETFMRHRISGLAIMPTSLGDNYATVLEQAVKVPAVLVDRILPGTRFCAVSDDNRHGARLIVRYLVDLGHRDIAILTGRPGISSSDERLAGFIENAVHFGLPVRQDLICKAVHLTDHALLATQQLMSLSNPPTAIISINIAQTRGIMIGLKAMGLCVPQDVSVASFDGFHASQGFFPEITSLAQDIEAISSETARMLLNSINAGDQLEDPEVIRISPRFNVRESCARVKG